jgi:hypothetical protein
MLVFDATTTSRTTKGTTTTNSSQTETTGTGRKFDSILKVVGPSPDANQQEQPKDSTHSAFIVPIVRIHGLGI